MMNFEERKAEIFRRSDERIKTRKQNRKRLLLSCMSLIILVSVISAVVAKPLMKEYDSKSESPLDNDGLPENFVYEVTADNTEKGILLNNALSYGSISLHLPDNWEYDTFEGDDIFSPNENDRYYGIEIWPYGHNEEKIKIEFCPYFGVCGTGLTEKKTTIGNYEASMGFYNNSKVWSFIVLTGDAQRDYVIWNECSEELWSDYGDEAMAILDTLLVGNDVTDTDN